MTESNKWIPEEDDAPEESSISQAMATSSKIEEFKARHPSQYSAEELAALKLPLSAPSRKEHHPVWIVLVGSEEKDDWGVTEDTLGNLLWAPGEGDLVGTWSRSSLDGRIHISLLTAISALEDRTVTIWAKYAEERKAQKATGKRKRTAKAKIEEPEPADELPVETKMEFNSLRARLRRGSSKEDRAVQVEKDIKELW